MPSSGGRESLAWRQHIEPLPRSQMISQSGAKRKLTYHNHTRTKKRNHTSASIVAHRPRQKAQAGRPAWQVVRLRTHAHRAAAQHRHRWRVGKRSHRRFNRGKVHASSQHVVQTHLRRSWPHLPWVVGYEKHVRSIKRRAQPQQKRALRRNADAVLARPSVKGSKCTTEDDVCQKACSVIERSNRSARATYQKSAAIDCSPQRGSAMQCRPRSAFAARTAGKPRVSRATRRVCGGSGRPSSGRATRGRGLGGTMGALRVSRARP